MTETPAPDVAVQIVAEVLAPYGLRAKVTVAHGVVAALARADWLHDPAEVAALRAVVREVRDVLPLIRALGLHPGPLIAALDAAPAGTTAEAGMSDNPQP